MAFKNLQNEDSDSTEDFELEEDSAQEHPADSDSDNDGNHEQSASDDENEDDDDSGEQDEEEEPAHVVISRHHAKAREEERRRLEAEQRLQQYESKEVEQPVIPPIPDSFEDNYEQKMQERDAKIREVIQWEADQKQRDYSRNENSQRTQREQQVEMQQIGQTYMQRAKKMGVKLEDLQAGSKQIQEAGFDESLVRSILEDDKGPLITRYMAQNPMAALKISQMNPIQAVQYMERTIRPKLQAKKTSKTPPPPDKKGGNSTSKHRNRFPLTSGKAKFS